MRNKKLEQEAKRLEHRLRMREQRNKEPSFDRPSNIEIEKPTILIVCEGKNTEPSYFNQFELSSATVKAVGEGYNTVSLVERAKQLADAKEYDQVWCVFDKDDFTDQNFNEAIVKAQAYGFHAAWSNQAFEYWMILHFDDHQGGAMHRSDYNDKINALVGPLGATYDGAGCKNISEELFLLMEPRINLAISRAIRNEGHHTGVTDAQAESVTMVYKLVEELLMHMQQIKHCYLLVKES
ncbi:MAG: RloB family protein [Reichenbachiella sp.]